MEFEFEFKDLLVLCHVSCHGSKLAGYSYEIDYECIVSDDGTVIQVNDIGDWDMESIKEIAIELYRDYVDIGEYRC